MHSDSKHAPKGYLSEESKRQFTLTTGILGAVFFFGQMVIPFVLMALLMPAMMLGGAMDISVADLGRAEAWKDEIWTVNRRMGNPGRPSAEVVLRSLGPGADAKLVDRATIPVDSAWLLAAPDRLWVISDRTVRTFTDAGLSPPQITDPVSPMSRPFLYKGEPAFVQRTPDAVVLLALGKEGWKEAGTLDVGLDEEHPRAWDVRVVSAGDVLHVFRKIDATIYHRVGLRGESRWTTVATSGSHWSAILSGGAPVVFSELGNGGRGAELVGVRLQKGTWEPCARHPVPLMGDKNVVATGPDRFSILVQGFPGSVRVIDVADGKATQERRAGKGFPFPGAFMTMFFAIQAGSLLTPVLMAVILSGLMARHRVADFGAGDQKVPFASLTRRALAQVIDSAIGAGPMALAGVTLFSSFDDFVLSPPDMLRFFGFMALGFVWLGIAFFLFSWTEGRSGWTPGKGLLGIRVVGIDLQPCGFGRALIRNLLKFADGFMNFLVGILVSALSENWQRVGDMAARTVVIRADAYRALRQPRF